MYPVNNNAISITMVHLYTLVCQYLYLYLCEGYTFLKIPIDISINKDFFV